MTNEDKILKNQEIILDKMRELEYRLFTIGCYDEIPKEVISQKLIQFWQEEGINHLIPNNSNEYPEGFEVLLALQKFIPYNSNIIDVGCGNGRLCKAFSPQYYLGLDISKKSIVIAKSKYPEYTFNSSNIDELPSSYYKLCYTVALHVPDIAIEDFVKMLCSKTTHSVLLVEILGEEHRKAKRIPPAFNRNLEVYEKLFLKYKFKLTEYGEHDYKYYKDKNISFLKFTRKAVCQDSWNEKPKVVQL